MKKKPNNPDSFLNTNEMVSDYLFSRQMIIENRPMDFERNPATDFQVQRRPVT